MKKKFLFSIFIISILFSIAFPLSACGKPEGGFSNSLTSKSETQSLFTLVDGLDFKSGTETIVEYKIVSDAEKTFGYEVKVSDYGFTLKISDGVTRTYSSSDTASIETAKIDYENSLNANNANKTFDGNLKGVAFAKVCDLINLNSSTVRSVATKYNGDGTITYTPSLYESKISKALPAFKNQFESVLDVNDLIFFVDEMGTKTVISVEMIVALKNCDDLATVLLTVTHTKTVKVID